MPGGKMIDISFWEIMLREDNNTLPANYKEHANDGFS